MDIQSIHIVIASIGLILTWLVFNEKRMLTMREQLIEKIQDKQELNEVVQTALKNQLDRVEGKMDMLIQLNLEHRNSNTK